MPVNFTMGRMPFAGRINYSGGTNPQLSRNPLQRLQPTPTVGGNLSNGQMGPHVGGDTWEMNSNKDGVQYNGPQRWSAGFSGGGDRGQRIQGYMGNGIRTDWFQDATGRAPTAGDYEAMNGGSLSPAFPQMGSLPQNVPHGATTAPQMAGHAAGPSTTQMADQAVGNAMKAASEASNNSFFPSPTIQLPGVGNAGQPMGQPQRNGIYATDETARQKRVALRSGTYGNYMS